MRKTWRSTVKWDMPRTSDLFSFFLYLNGYEFFIFVYCGKICRQRTERTDNLQNSEVMTGTGDVMELLRICSLNILIEQNGWDEETLYLICRLVQNSVEHLEDKDELKRCKYGLTDENIMCFGWTGNMDAKEDAQEVLKSEKAHEK